MSSDYLTDRAAALIMLVLLSCSVDSRIVVSQPTTPVAETSIVPLRVIHKDMLRWQTCPLILKKDQFPQGATPSYSRVLKIQRVPTTYGENYIIRCAEGKLHDLLCALGSQLEISVPPGTFLPVACWWDGDNGYCSFREYDRNTNSVQIGYRCNNPPITTYSDD
jgi:hypothetical protein